MGNSLSFTSGWDHLAIKDENAIHFTFFLVFSPWASQGQDSVGEDRSSGDGCAQTWLTLLQRGGFVAVQLSYWYTLQTDHLCFWIKEAAELSSLRSLLQEMEVPLFAVVKENIGKELDSFKKYFDGKVYVDQKVYAQSKRVTVGSLSVGQLKTFQIHSFKNIRDFFS